MVMAELQAATPIATGTWPDIGAVLPGGGSEVGSPILKSALVGAVVLQAFHDLSDEVD